MRNEKITEDQHSRTGLAEGLMQMSQKGALRKMRLTRARAEALIESLKDVIYYFPDCRCDDGDDCRCHDNYFAGIHWIKQYIFRFYPDLSGYENPTAHLFAAEKLKKTEAIYLREALEIAHDHNDDRITRDAVTWAYNIIYKNYSHFDLFA